MNVNIRVKLIQCLLVQVTELPLVHSQKANDREEETKQTHANALVPHSYSDYKVFSGINSEKRHIITSNFFQNEINKPIQFFHRKPILESPTLKH